MSDKTESQAGSLDTTQIHLYLNEKVTAGGRVWTSIPSFELIYLQIGKDCPWFEHFDS